MDIFTKLQLLFIIMFVISVSLNVAWALTKKHTNSRRDGTIVINTNDPNKDTYRIELDIPFGELDDREKVIFSVKHE